MSTPNANAPTATPWPSTELVLRELLSASNAHELNDAVAYVEFLRTCIEPRAFDVTWLRRPTELDDDRHRFEAIVARLASELPPIPVPTALDVARVADDLRGRREVYKQSLWLGDVGTHAALSSSDGRMGRVLSAAVRFGRPSRCLELGTAYGISGLFLLAELERTSAGGVLTTVEVREPQFGIARAVLEARHPNRVRCELLNGADDLPGLLGAIGPLDLVFHDAEHSGAAYERDFEMLVPHLSPGAVVIFDNIRWDHHAFSGGPSRTYEGWQTIASDERVISAVECTADDIGDAWGVLLVHGGVASA